MFSIRRCFHRAPVWSSRLPNAVLQLPSIVRGIACASGTDQDTRSGPELLPPRRASPAGHPPPTPSGAACGVRPTPSRRPSPGRGVRGPPRRRARGVAEVEDTGDAGQRPGNLVPDPLGTVGQDRDPVGPLDTQTCRCALLPRPQRLAGSGCRGGGPHRRGREPLLVPVVEVARTQPAPLALGEDRQPDLARHPIDVGLRRGQGTDRW